MNTKADKPIVSGLSHRVIGVGASAGGLEAISSMFQNMPSDTGMSFVVVQHLSPDYKSMMTSLISKVTDMPVEVIKDGTVPEPNHIYLIPPSQNLTIFHGKLLLSAQDRTSSMVNLPIDLFFKSLADDMEELAVGVILSGTGSDGTRGCRAIKEKGGLVIAQNEETAKFAGMPHSVITADLVDYVVPVDQLSQQLLNFVEHVSSVPKDKQEDVTRHSKSAISKVFSMLRSKTKVDFSFYKPQTITRRIERRLSITLCSSLDGYVEYLSEHPEELTLLYKELLIGVTSFYRDPEVFDALFESHLREQLKNATGNEFRLWVAGCSTGEEAYTYCMMISEICEEEGLNLEIKVFATDIDQDALNKASMGVYPESIVADLPRHFLTKYLIHKEDQYSVNRQLREMIVFARHDLIKDPPFTNIDLISCRNMLIYLQPVLQQRIFDAFVFSLKKSALLVLGTSETLGDHEVNFKTLHQRHKIYQSLGSSKLPPVSTSSDNFGLSRNVTSLWRVNNEGAHDRRPSDDTRLLEAYVDLVADSYVPFSMIVNQEYDLVRVMGDSRRYINPVSGRITPSLTKLLVKDLVVPVTTGLKKVFESMKDLNFTDIAVRTNDSYQRVNVAIKLFEYRKNAPKFAAVIITDKQTSTDKLDNTKTYDVDTETAARISDLEQELQFSRESLQATIEELETSNEELQATNEELLASNEELQSTNEELQSVNEELFTVNSEHQDKITELSESNADLYNFMSASKMIAMFLDLDLLIRRFTSNSKIVFNILEHDIGRPISHISHQIIDTDLSLMVSDVAKSGVALSQQVKTKAGDWYRINVMPYLINEKVHAGIVIVLHEVNQIVATQNSVMQLMQMREIARESNQLCAWELNSKSREMFWDHNVADVTGIAAFEADILLEDFLRLVAKPDQADVENEVLRLLSHGGASKVKHRLKVNEHETIWVEQTMAAMSEERDFCNFTVIKGVMSRL